MTRSLTNGKPQPLAVDSSRLGRSGVQPSRVDRLCNRLGRKEGILRDARMLCDGKRCCVRTGESDRKEDGCQALRGPPCGKTSQPTATPWVCRMRRSALTGRDIDWNRPARDAWCCHVPSGLDSLVPGPRALPSGGLLIPSGFANGVMPGSGKTVCSRREWFRPSATPRTRKSDLSRCSPSVFRPSYSATGPLWGAFIKPRPPGVVADLSSQPAKAE